MSSLTDEQKKRIEENRARALAKLAEKKSLTRPHNQNISGSIPIVKQTAFYNIPSSSKNESSNNNNFRTSLSRFEYHRGGSKRDRSYKTVNAPCNHKANNNKANNSQTAGKAKNVNDALMNNRVVIASCVLMNKTRFKVVAAFHAKLIGIFKSLLSKCYDPDTRTWNFLLDDYEKLMSLCKPLAGEVTLTGFPKEVARLFLSQKKEIPFSEAEINWNRIDKKLVESLMPFQREGVIFSIKQNGRVLLADDMGLGKTIQAIAVAVYYKEKWPLLVVVPSSLRMTWKRALMCWLPSIKPEQVNVVLTGKDEPNTGLVNIISYDLLVKKFWEIEKIGYGVIIADECHSIKNHKAERTKALLPMLKASSHVILISGTPALSRPAELHTQITAVKPKLFPSFHEYGVRYCAAVKNKFGWDYSGSSNMEELQVILEECVMIRRLKKHVLDQLPPKRREIVYLDPSLIKDKSLAQAEKQLVEARKRDKRSALLEYFTETSTVKAKAVREYIMDLLEGGHKLIVFAHHINMVDVISEAFVKKKIEHIRIDGKTLSVRRQHLCDQFQRDTRTRAAVLSITAANTGLTLTAATCVVFAELFWNPGALVQAEDRAYRIGQKNSVLIHYLLAKKTADDYLWPLIQKKLDVLSEAGLNEESFSDLDTKMFQDPKQRDVKDLIEGMIEEFDNDDSFVEDCLLDQNSCTTCSGETNSEQNTGGAETSLASRVSCESSQSSLTNNKSEDWFDNIDNDEWDVNFHDTECAMEPSAKRKRL